MGLGRNTGLKCQLDGTEHGLFIVLQNEGQDLHHLPVTAGTLEEMPLQLPERFGHLGEGRPVAQGAGLALDHRQIVPPVVDRPPWQVMRSFDDPRMLAQDLALGGDDDPFRVDPQADRPVGEGGRHTVAVALEVDEAGRRYSLGVFDEAIEGAAQRHQAGNLVGMHIGDGAGQATMLDLAPLLDATLLKPGVQGIDIGEAGQRLPQPTPRILDVLLDLSLLPTGSRVAELWLEQVMAGHGREPGVDLPRLASANAIDCGLHVVEDPALRHAAQHPERLGQGIEQHLVGLEQIGPHDERPAVRQLAYAPPAASCARRRARPSPRSSRTGRLRLARRPKARRCRARWSAAHAGGRPSRPAQRQQHDRRIRRSPGPQDRHASAWPCAAACVTCRLRSAASQTASRQTDPACSADREP